MSLGQKIKFTVFLPGVILHELMHYIVAKKYVSNTEFKLPVGMPGAVYIANKKSIDSIEDLELDNRFGVRTEPEKGDWLIGEFLYHIAPIVLLPIGLAMIWFGIDFNSIWTIIFSTVPGIQIAFAGLLSTDDIREAMEVFTIIFL
jgi:hypothetical protein